MINYNWELIKTVLAFISLPEPDVLFVAPRESSLMCLHFARLPDLNESEKKYLESLGVMVSAKYETLCISTESLYDNKDL